MLYRASFHYFEQNHLYIFQIMYDVIKNRLSFCNIQLFTPTSMLLKTIRWQGWFDGNFRVNAVLFHNLQEKIIWQSCFQSNVIVSYIMRRIYYLISKSKIDVNNPRGTLCKLSFYSAFFLKNSLINIKHFK